ncbi:putative TonB-dependent receptor [Azoarcus olearius]|uniref:TonB-dependent siderophore receptor n=1 Tax=Azoarcus sp. (strain BH72) TaxID=418699 RepID=UPI0008060B3E|nr:TonB-dependent siderophore receptor [Azoarcus olearius]ANQ86161.1 putative TonB-dependent receptor [Azoarcus olearius]
MNTFDLPLPARQAAPYARGRLTALILAALAPGLAHAQQTTPTLPAVTVTEGTPGETATGPVQGYVARRSATATKTDTALADTPQSVSVITAERMRDQGAQTVQDALRYTAGMRGETYGLDSRGDWSTVRGSDPVVFLDGMQQTFGYYASARPDPFSLERIEVLKGPASVLYGQGTVGGIVNLVSKRPQEEQQGELQLQYGSFDRKQLAVDVTGPLNEDRTLLYRVVAIGRDSDTQVKKVEDDRYVLAPSLTWRPDSTLEWTVLANVQKDETGSTTQFLPHAGTVLPAPGGLGRIPVDVFMSEPGFDEYNTEQKSLTSLFTYRPNDTWTFRQNLRYSESEVSYQTIYPAFPPVLQPDGDIDRVYWVAKPELKYWTVDNQLQANLQHGRLRQTVLAGLDYQYALTKRRWAYGAAGTLNLYNPVYGNFTPPGAGDFYDDPDNTVRQTGVYVQDQLTWDERWIAVIGLRHDRAVNETEGGETQKDSAVTKRLALMYKADGGFSPYVSYTESFKPEIGLDGYGKAFKPLRGKQYELGVKYEPAGGAGLVSAAVYDLREQNRKSPDPINPLNQLQSGETRVRGLELEAQLRITRDWDLIGTYSYTDSEVLEGTNEGKRLPSVPEQMASLWSQHRFSIAGFSGFRAGFGIRYIGDSRDGTDSLTTPGYTLYDAMLGYDVGRWSLALNVNNIGDKTYYTTCLSRGDCFVGTRRTVLATASYRF